MPAANAPGKPFATCGFFLRKTRRDKSAGFLYIKKPKKSRLAAGIFSNGGGCSFASTMLNIFLSKRQ